MTIIVDTTVFGGPNPTTPGKQVELLVGALRSAGVNVGSYGNILARWVKDPNPHYFVNYEELAMKLSSAEAVGAQRNAVGDMREADACAAVNAWTGRSGLAAPAWAAGFYDVPPGGQDPTVWARQADGTRNRMAAPVKADIWSESLLGIVGGGAKDGRIGDFQRVCGELRIVCDSHRIRPVVFAAFGATDSRGRAAMVVGADNTYVQDVHGGPWRRMSDPAATAGTGGGQLPWGTP
ncbi:hypothetical protein QZN11_19780 [Streptomyces gramineus]|uniref:hypothetical protein n=1 Tax=Streptomyces gramineus TaxID=910542 RepID=UPI00398AA9F5